MRLVQREAEIEALTALWNRARGGRGGFVMLAAEPGGGKTSLIEAFGDSLAGQAPVLRGACDPLQTPRPLGPLRDLRHALGPGVQAALEGDAPAHDVYESVFAAVRDRPCVLVVEDLHWADQGTIEALRFLLRRIAMAPSLVIGTLRRDEIEEGSPQRALLGDLAGSADAAIFDLPSLTPASVQALLDDLGGDRGIDPDWLVSVTAGNPFFVNEMLQHWEGQLPTSISDAVLARTVGLDAEARGFIDLLACAPEAIPERLMPALDVEVETLRSVHRTGLVQRGAAGVTFRHDLCRQAVRNALPPGAASRLHRQMLAAWEESGGTDPAVLVHHARGAHDNDKLLTHALAAGEVATRGGAHSQAAEFFGLALVAVPPGQDALRATLLERLAYEQHLLDQLPRAIRSIRRAIELRDALGHVDDVSLDHQALSLYEWYDANRETADQHAASAVAVSREHGDPLVLGHALANQAYLAVQASELTTAQELLGRAHGITAAVDDTALDTRLAVVEAVRQLAEGLDEPRNAIEDLIRGRLDSFNDTLSSGFSNLAYSDVEFRRLDNASELLERSLPLTVEWDLPICRVWQLGARSRLHMLRGEWDRAVSDAEQVLTAHSAPLARTWPSLVRGLVRLRRGEPVGSDLDDAWALAHRLGEPLRLLPAAAGVLERAWVTGSDDHVDNALALLGTSHEAGLEWATGELAVWARRVAPETTVDTSRVAEPYRLQLTGQHRAAAELWESVGAPYDMALALFDAGDQSSRRRALDVLDALGADAVAARLRQALRAAGEPTIRARRRSTRSNAAGLTAREAQVLSLLGDGLSNTELASRLFISPKTVDHHVSAILTKLGVGNRHDAVSAGRELGLV